MSNLKLRSPHPLSSVVKSCLFHQFPVSVLLPSTKIRIARLVTRPLPGIQVVLAVIVVVVVGFSSRSISSTSSNIRLKVTNHVIIRPQLANYPFLN